MISGLREYRRTKVSSHAYTGPSLNLNPDRPVPLDRRLLMARFVIFAERLFRSANHRVHAVPFILGVVQVKTLGARRTLQRDLVWRRWLDTRSGKSDHNKARIAYSPFVRHGSSVRTFPRKPHHKVQGGLWMP